MSIYCPKCGRPATYENVETKKIWLMVIRIRKCYCHLCECSWEDDDE